MTKSSSPIARIVAVAALALAVILVFVVVSGSTGGDDDTGKKDNRVAKSGNTGGGKKPKTKAKVYEVQPDDTLTGIAAETGISVEKIQNLNPDLDPQALQAGQKLKLR